MRLIWKRKHGFTLMSYPVDGDDGKGFKAAILDSEDKIWGLSDETYDNTNGAGETAKGAWDEFLKDYIDNHDYFPDQDICENYREIIESKSVTIKELIEEKVSDDNKDTEKSKTDGEKNK